MMHEYVIGMLFGKIISPSKDVGDFGGGGSSSKQPTTVTLLLILSIISACKFLFRNISSNNELLSQKIQK